MTIKKLKKPVALLLAAILMAVPSVSASAAGGNTTISGEGTTSMNNNGLYNSTPVADLTNNNYEIEVSALTSGSCEITYDIRVSWGDMQFKYDYGSTWDPINHTYTMGASGEQKGGWVMDGYVDGINNKISVVNNSNFPVVANFGFDENTTLNANKNANKSVVGIFSTNNADFTSAVLQRGKGGTGILSMETKYINLEMDASQLAANTDYYATSGAAACTAVTSKGDMYFALSGIPDKNGPSEYTTVGKLTINIAPYPGATLRTK